MGIILNEGQEQIRQQAVDWFYHSSEQVFEIEGPAGSGKSVLIYEILKSLQLTHAQILPMAYTGQASIVMRTKGFITARSIHSALYELVEYYDTSDINNKFSTPRKKRVFKLREMIDPNIDLFFIDEAYMVPKSMKQDILSFGKKVLVAGDSNQLPPIGGEPGFLTGYGVHRLTELVRQAADSAIVYLANRAMKGLPIHCGVYGNEVLVVNDSDFTPQMIQYADCIACGTNKTRDILNTNIRHLAGFDWSLLPLYGERVICRNNNWNISYNGIALANGLCGTVISSHDPSSHKDLFTIDFAPDLISDVVFPDLILSYKYFTAPYEQKAEIKNQAKDYYIGELFEFAYALTTHLCQGSEYNRGIYIEEFMRHQIQNQLNYTGITRFKKGLIYIKKTNKFIYVGNQDKIVS